MQVTLSISFLLSQYILLSFLFALDVCQSAVLKQNVKNSPASIDPIVESWGLKELFVSRRHRRCVFHTNPLNTNPSIDEIASQTNYFANVYLHGKTQVFLQVTPDGTVNGTENCISDYAKLEMQSMGQGMKRIKGIRTGRFVAINANGDLYSTVSYYRNTEEVVAFILQTTPSDETIFKQQLDRSSYSTFASAKYYKTSLYDAFIAIGRNGVARNAASTDESQSKVKFLVIAGDTDGCS